MEWGSLLEAGDKGIEIFCNNSVPISRFLMLGVLDVEQEASFLELEEPIFSTEAYEAFILVSILQLFFKESMQQRVWRLLNFYKIQ